MNIPSSTASSLTISFDVEQPSTSGQSPRSLTNKVLSPKDTASLFEPSKKLTKRKCSSKKIIKSSNEQRTQSTTSTHSNVTKKPKKTLTTLEFTLSQAKSPLQLLAEAKNELKAQTRSASLYVARSEACVNECVSLMSSDTASLKEKTDAVEQANMATGLSQAMVNGMKIALEDVKKAKAAVRALNVAARTPSLLKGVSSRKPFFCQVCKKTLPQGCNAKAHLRIHTGERPYNCKHCSSSFKQKSHLVTHEKTHQGIKAYQCSHCSMRFSRNSSLKTHIGRFHATKVC